jgi:hypothetical protein
VVEGSGLQDPGVSVTLEEAEGSLVVLCVNLDRIHLEAERNAETAERNAEAAARISQALVRIDDGFITLQAALKGLTETVDRFIRFRGGGRVA